MAKENQSAPIPWGLPLAWPDKKLRELGLSENSYLTILGCGDSEFLIEQQKRYSTYTVGIDISDDIRQLAGRKGDNDSRLFAYWEDLTLLPNHLTRTGHTIREDIKISDEPAFYVCSSLLVNLVEPSDRHKLAAALTYSLDSRDILVILEHLRKDSGPYSEQVVQEEYKMRYEEANAQGRPYGDTWTQHPPRWVHHFTFTELEELFPYKFYSYLDKAVIPYTGDSGKTTNACQLILEMRDLLSVEEIEQYYGVKLL